MGVCSLFVNLGLGTVWATEDGRSDAVLASLSTSQDIGSPWSQQPLRVRSSSGEGPTWRGPESSPNSPTTWRNILDAGLRALSHLPRLTWVAHSRVDERLLLLQPGIRAVPLRWESQLQDTGPQETSQLHVIPNGENLPEISISTSRPSFTQRPASYSAGHPMPNN